jgi:hypothetical protein
MDPVVIERLLFPQRRFHSDVLTATATPDPPSPQTEAVDP